MYMKLSLMSTNTAGDVMLLYEPDRKEKENTHKTIKKENDYLRTT